MIRGRTIRCDGCGVVGGRDEFGGPARDRREFLEGLIDGDGWLIGPAGHHCRTCRLAIEWEPGMPLPGGVAGLGVFVGPAAAGRAGGRPA